MIDKNSAALEPNIRAYWEFIGFILFCCFIRGVFKKYADRCCHSLSFLLKGVKLAHNDTQRILYVQWKFDTIDFKHDQTSVIMVTLGRHTRPNVIQRHVDFALSQSDFWLFFFTYLSVISV